MINVIHSISIYLTTICCNKRNESIIDCLYWLIKMITFSKKVSITTCGIKLVIGWVGFGKKKYEIRSTRPCFKLVHKNFFNLYVLLAAQSECDKYNFR